MRLFYFFAADTLAPAHVRSDKVFAEARTCRTGRPRGKARSPRTLSARLFPSSAATGSDIMSHSVCQYLIACICGASLINIYLIPIFGGTFIVHVFKRRSAERTGVYLCAGQGYGDARQIFATIEYPARYALHASPLSLNSNANPSEAGISFS